MGLWTIAVPLLLAAVFLSGAMSFAWALAWRTGQSGWVDTIWSLAVGVAGVLVVLVPVLVGGEELTSRRILAASLVALWSLRLGLSIARRTLKGGDDPRYKKLKEEWGSDAPRQLFRFLQIQAAAGFILAAAVFAATRNPDPALGLADLLAALLLIVSIAGATTADWQLERFKADPANRGGLCEVGLWAYSRHPNYFFEWLGWCAYPIFALGSGLLSPWFALSLAAPALMYWVLVYASGIPPLEEHMLRSRGDAFRAYQRRVNAFWPGPRRP